MSPGDFESRIESDGGVGIVLVVLPVGCGRDILPREDGGVERALAHEELLVAGRLVAEPVVTGRSIGDSDGGGSLAEARKVGRCLILSAQTTGRNEGKGSGGELAKVIAAGGLHAEPV
jgi:hypothetical protein